MKKLLAFILVSVLCFASIAPSTAYSATIKLNKSKLTLDEGGLYALTITGTTKTVQWTSDDKAIAIVSSKGKVTAVSKGTTTITATVSSKKYTCKVTVKEVFNSKTAVKNIVSTLENTSSGVVAILENNYTFPFSLSATVVFYDAAGSMIGKSTDDNYYFEKGKKCSMFFHGPYDSDYKNVEYDTYEISYSVSALSNIKSNLSDISIESNIGVDNVMVKASNNGDQTAEYTQISVVFYKNDIIVSRDYQYADVQEPGSDDFLEFSFPYDSNYDTIQIDNFKVFINSSYYYSW